MEELVVEEVEEDRCDIHAKDLSLVCEGLDGRTANVQRADDDQVGVVRAVEKMDWKDDSVADLQGKGVVESLRVSSAMV